MQDGKLGPDIVGLFGDERKENSWTVLFRSGFLLARYIPSSFPHTP